MNEEQIKELCKFLIENGQRNLEYSQKQPELTRNSMAIDSEPI